MHRLRKDIQQKRLEFDNKSSQSGTSQSVSFTSERSEQLHNEQIIENLVQEKVYLHELVKDLFVDVEKIFQQADLDQQRNLARIQELSRDFKAKEDELRLSLEKGRIDEHKSELKFKESMSVLEKSNKKLSKQNQEYKKDILYLEKSITSHQSQIANQKKQMEQLQSKLAKIKTYPDVVPKFPHNPPNAPHLHRLQNSVSCICAYVSVFNEKITLNERNNPYIQQPVHQFIRNLRITLSYGTKSSHTALWSFVMKPVLDMNFANNLQFNEIKSIIRKVDTGAIPNAFRDRNKMETFLLYCLNHQKLHSWLEFIFTHESVLNKYEPVSVLHNPLARNKLMSHLHQIAQLRFNVFHMTDRLTAEKEMMEKENKLRQRDLADS